MRIGKLSLNQLPILRLTAFPTLSLPLYVAFISVAVITVAIVAIRSAAMVGLNRQSPDPFLPYITIFPNAPAEALADFNCQGTQQPTERPMYNALEATCFFFPENGSPFHLVSVRVREDQIQEITFFSQYLQIDQLTQLWGNPKSVRTSQFHDAFTFQWDRGGYITSMVVLQRRDLTVARKVTFSQK